MKTTGDKTVLTTIVSKNKKIIKYASRLANLNIISIPTYDHSDGESVGMGTKATSVTFRTTMTESDLIKLIDLIGWE